MVLRSVSDLLDEDLPLDFNLFLHPHSWPEALWVSAARPRRVLELVRLRRQMVMACERLTALLIRWLDDGVDREKASALKSTQGHA